MLSHVEPRGAVLTTVLKIFEEGILDRVAWLRRALLVPNAAIGPASHFLAAPLHLVVPGSTVVRWLGLRLSIELDFRYGFRQIFTKIRLVRSHHE